MTILHTYTTVIEEREHPEFVGRDTEIVIKYSFHPGTWGRSDPVRGIYSPPESSSIEIHSMFMKDSEGRLQQLHRFPELYDLVTTDDLVYEILEAHLEESDGPGEID